MYFFHHSISCYNNFLKLFVASDIIVYWLIYQYMQSLFLNQAYIKYSS